jgi:nitrite reductase/ring-hydroxylating ferredoxin subunit
MDLRLVIRVAAGAPDRIAAGRPLAVSLPADASGRPRTALVVRDQDGDLHAYLNECRHIPIPLDAGPRASRVMNEAGHLRCLTHGAIFRVSDGLCIDGPCEGLALFRLPVEVEDGIVYVVA